MKFKRYITGLLALLGVVFFAGCNYLNIVPDGTPTDKDAFANPKAAERYLYSCYGYIPKPSASTAIDFLTGDEVVTPYEHEGWAHFPKGSYNATNPQLSYWNTLFTGIRYCYTLIRDVDGVPNLNPEIAADYKAQAEFLIAYFHYLLIQNYGPTVLIRGIEDINVPVEEFRTREPLDECVKFVEEMLDSAASKLPATRSGNEFGLATSVAAKAIKAKLHVLVASPLFNGNSEFYANFKNPDGTPLMPLTFEQSKWDKALVSAKEAVEVAEAAGHKLYVDDNYNLTSMPFPNDKTQRSLRMAILDSDNSTEVVWGDTRDQGAYDIMPKSAPLFPNKWAWTGIGVTLNMMKRFYTENGLPLDEDPNFPAESEWWNLMTVPTDYKYAEERIPKFLYERDPRLYAWVAFQNGYYEIGGAGNYNDAQGQKTLYSRTYQRGGNNANRLIVKTMIGEVNGRGPTPDQLRNNDYNPTGFLNKRLVHPRKTPDQSRYKYIHPYVTLSDLYLLYAEAAVECNQLDVAKAQLDKIRTRAGLPTVTTAWAGARSPGKANTKEGMRDIVRQERAIELYLLNQNFWDMRRWLLAEEYFDQKPKGMNVNSGTTLETYTRVTELDVERQFTSPRNYLMPIPQGEINKNANLTQNPGY